MSDSSTVVAMSPKVRSRQNRTRQRILVESARLFTANGFENVSVEEIIDASEVARSSFYRFFSNREDLLAQIVRPVFERGREMLAAAPVGDAGAVMDHILHVYLSLWRDDPDAMRVSTRVGGVHFSIFRDVHEAYRTELLRLLEQVAAAGILLNGDARQTGGLIARIATRVLETYADSPRLEELFIASMRGLLLAPDYCQRALPEGPTQ